MESEDVIRIEMDETREKISEKLDMLERKLSQSVDEATAVVTTVKETVHESVASVKESVQDTVATVKESVHETVDSVKDLMDVEKQWERHPWLLAGGAMACGFVLATATASSRRNQRSDARAFQTYQSPVRNNLHPPQPEPPTVTDPNENWLGAFAPELNMLKKLALGVTFGAIRDLIANQVPSEMAPTVCAILDSVTRKMGGEPLTSETIVSSTAPNPSKQIAPTASAESKTPKW